MAQLSAGIQTWTNGKPVSRQQQYRLGEDQAEAELKTRSGTTIKVTLFADGSGQVTVSREVPPYSYTYRWTAEEDPLFTMQELTEATHD